MGEAFSFSVFLKTSNRGGKSGAFDNVVRFSVFENLGRTLEERLSVRNVRRPSVFPFSLKDTKELEKDCWACRKAPIIISHGKVHDNAH